MKLVEGVLIEELGDEYVAVATEKASEVFNGMIKLNNTAYYIMNLLYDDISYEGLIKEVKDHYEIDDDLSKKAVDAFLGKLRETGLLNE